MEKQKLNPEDFAHYRAFLDHRLRHLKSIDAKFSHRYVNQKMGAKSAGWFADVLAGRQTLKPRHVTPLSNALRLTAPEKDLLKTLVELEAADAPEDKHAAHDKWLELRGVTREDIDVDRMKYFDKWYYPALRELLLVAPFDGDHAKLAARLEPPITARQARDAIGTLKRLGLLNPDAPGPLLVKRPGKSSQWSALMKAYSDLSIPALQKYGKIERDFSALTLALSPQGLQAAGEEIAALRRRLLSIAARDSGSRRVYQTLFQVFPVTQSVENPNA